MSERAYNEQYDNQSNISLDDLRRIIEKMSVDDPEWSILAWHLADALYDKAVEDDRTDLLVESIARAQSVIDHIKADASERSALLSDKAITLWVLWEATSDVDVLESYIETLEEALVCGGQVSENETVFKTDNDTLQSDIMINLASGLAARYDLWGDEDDRARALTLWQDAINDPHINEENKAIATGDLAIALGREGNQIKELKEAVKLARSALDFVGADSFETGNRRIALGNTLITLFESTQKQKYLVEGIAALTKGLEEIGGEHKNYAGYAANLMLALRTRFFCSGNVENLEAASELISLAENSMAVDNADRCHVFTSSGTVLRELALQSGQSERLDDALAYYEKAIESAEVGSNPWTMAVINMSTVLRDKAEADASQQRQFLDKSVKLAEIGLEVTSKQGFLGGALLGAAANAYRDRYAAFGNRNDLDKALSLTQKAVDATEPGDPDRARRLTNLAVVLSDRYDEYQSIEDLDAAIDLYEQALAEDDHEYGRVEERSLDLAMALRDRFSETKSLDDLERAINLNRKTIINIMPASPSRPGYITALANALVEQFEITRNLRSLTEALSYYREAVQITPEDRVEYSGYSMNLGLALSELAIVTNSEQVMAEAIHWMKVAIDKTPEDKRDRALRLSNYADVWRMRAVMSDGTADMFDKAVELNNQALALLNDDDVARLQVLSNLAISTRQKAAASHNAGLAKEALKIQRQAALTTAARAHERFEQTARWAYWAENDGEHAQAIEAYERSVSMMPDVAWRGLSIAERIAFLSEAGVVLGDAVSYAVKSGEFVKALAWADKGRSVVWSQLASVASEAHEAGLSTLEYEAITAGVFGSHIGSLESSSPLSGRTEDVAQDGHSRRPASHEIALRHKAARALDRLKKPVPIESSTYSDLRPAGYIVLLAHSSVREELCVMIICPDGDTSVFALPIASDDIAGWVNDLQEAVASLQTSFIKARKMFVSVLRELWSFVCEPVLQRICNDVDTRASKGDGSGQQGLPRLWWSPIGNIASLPLHAAGIYPHNAEATYLYNNDVKKQRQVSSMVVSSYLRRISTLTVSQKCTGDPTLLLVTVDRQDGAEDGSHVGGTAMIYDERGVVQSSALMPIVTLSDNSAILDDVMEGIKSNELLHLAAHGHQEPGRPFESGVNLADGTLRLSDLAGMKLKDARLAIVLACDVASGDKTVPNEALHLVSALESAGYRSVIGAVMPVDGKAALMVAEYIYKNLGIADEKSLCMVPYALHDAVEHLKNADKHAMTNPFIWAPFAHFGA
jgi:tetratricopeptide (TPR) repeat protein